MDGIIKAKTATFLKKQPVDSSKLTSPGLSPVPASKVWQAVSIDAVKTDWSHLRISLAAGAGAWFIFARHWELPEGIDPRCVEIVKQFEGCKLEAYVCPAGVLTIGYGRAIGVRAGDRITQRQAEEYLSEDLARFQDGVKALITAPVTSAMLSALTSLAYNIGGGAFAASTLLRRLNEGDYKGAAEQFLRWNRGGGQILPGLTRRREAEVALFWGDGMP